MLRWIRFPLGVCVLVAAVTLTGCPRSDQSQLDEEKEPHYVLGQSRVNAMDYQGAVEAFEESLEANPHSAAAHYQLAILFDGKASDPAAAIYHYQEYLKLVPNAGNADILRQRIFACKRLLAADVMDLPSAPAAQRQLENVVEQNRQLQDEVNKWRAYYASQLAAGRTNAPTPGTAMSTPTPAQSTQNSSAASGITTPTPSTGSATMVRPRTHTVAAGETAAGIARKYGLKLSALKAANPNIDPDRIRVGQVLNIPST